MGEKKQSKTNGLCMGCLDCLIIPPVKGTAGKRYEPRSQLHPACPSNKPEKMRLLLVVADPNAAQLPAFALGGCYRGFKDRSLTHEAQVKAHGRVNSSRAAISTGAFGSSQKPSSRLHLPRLCQGEGWICPRSAKLAAVPVLAPFGRRESWQAGVFPSKK